MQLLLIIGIVAAVASNQGLGEQALAYPLARLGLALLGMLLSWALAHRIARRFVARWRSSSELHRSDLLQWMERAQRGQALVWLLVSLTILFVLQWPQLLHQQSWLQKLPLLDDLALLLPIVAPWWMTWWAYYQIELALSPLQQSRPQQRRAAGKYLLFQTRQHLAPLLAPLLLLLGIEDALRLYGPQGFHPEQDWLWMLPAGLLLIAGFPLLMRRLWRTESLPPGPLRTQLEQALARRGWRVNQFYLWHTGGRMINAAVTGFLPGMRYVFLSDALLAQFSSEQVEAVVAHEVGHLQRKHLALRTAAVIMPALFLLALTRLLPQQEAQDPSPSIQAGLASFTTFSTETLLLPVGMLLYTATVLGRFCRLLELEADYAACLETTAHPRSWPRASPVTGHSISEPASSPCQAMCPTHTATFLSTLARLASTSDATPDRATWLHPSLTQRAQCLLSLWHSPAAQVRFVRHLRNTRWLLGLGCAAGVVLNLLLG